LSAATRKAIYERINRENIDAEATSYDTNMAALRAREIEARR
jgi:hypothetical protein